MPKGYGAGVGQISKINEQGNWYRGGVEQMLFFSWLYGVEHDKFKPRILAGATQEDLIRISRFYDLAPKNPPVDMALALNHLPFQDILKNIKGKNEIFDKMIRRKPNDSDWFKGGIYHDNMEIGVPNFKFTSWYDASITPNLALFNPVRNNSKDANNSIFNGGFYLSTKYSNKITSASNKPTKSNFHATTPDNPSE